MKVWATFLVFNTLLSKVTCSVELVETKTRKQTQKVTWDSTWLWPIFKMDISSKTSLDSSKLALKLFGVWNLELSSILVIRKLSILFVRRPPPSKMSLDTAPPPPPPPPCWFPMSEFRVLSPLPRFRHFHGAVPISRSGHSRCSLDEIPSN